MSGSHIKHTLVYSRSCNRWSSLLLCCVVHLTRLEMTFSSDEEPGEDSGVFPKAGSGASGSARMARLVRSSIPPGAGAEPKLLFVFFTPVGWYVPGLPAQLPQCSVPVHAYPYPELIRNRSGVLMHPYRRVDMSSCCVCVDCRVFVEICPVT